MRIFVSSTYDDLLEYRKKASDAIERLGQQGVRMEVFGARPEQATDTCLDEIESADAFVGIYAHRYGFVPERSPTSITEQEFDYAVSERKPTFCFLVDESYPWVPLFIDQDTQRSKLMAFKRKVQQLRVVDRFTTADDLAYKVAASVGRFLLTRRVKEELDRISGRTLVSTAEGRDQIARRAARLEQLVGGARILLVNDVPRQMEHVIDLLQNLKIQVDIATSSDEAIARLGSERYDVVISDMARDGVDDEGLRLLKRMRTGGVSQRLIFTVGRYQPERGTPAFAFGITNRVDELLNLVFDALERIRG
jgi:CheY-like chemotaxis protein